MQEFKIDAVEWIPDTGSPRACSPTMCQRLSEFTNADRFIITGHGSLQHLSALRHITAISASILSTRRSPMQIAYIDSTRVHLPKTMVSAATPSLIRLEIDASNSNAIVKEHVKGWSIDAWKQVLTNCFDVFDFLTIPHESDSYYSDGDLE